MLHLSVSSTSRFSHQTRMLYALSVHLPVNIFACPSLKEAWTVRTIKCVSDLCVNWSEPSCCSWLFLRWWLGRQRCGGKNPRETRRGKKKIPLFLFLLPAHSEPLGYFQLWQPSGDTEDQLQAELCQQDLIHEVKWGGYLPLCGTG